MASVRPLSDLQLGKKLSWLLRHGAHKEGLNIGADGYMQVTAILNHSNYAPHYTLATIKRLVENDNKQRFSLSYLSGTGEYLIKANQGHSMQAVEAELCLTPIQDATEVPLAVHGTYYRFWDKIRAEGLRTMQRNHIHFAVTDKVKPGISGFRSDCQVLIYVDVAKAITEGGMQFYRSQNNVILCSGRGGKIEKKYFTKVLDRKTMTALNF